MVPDPPEPSRPSHLTDGPDATVLAMTLAADPWSLSVVRERLRRWLAAMGWPEVELAEIVLAVNEAVSFVVQLAHPADGRGEVRVAGRCYTEAGGARRVIVGVSDDGRSRSARPDGSGGGAGIPIMYVCMDAVEVHRDSRGTTVVMTSVPRPPQPGSGAGTVPARGPA